jgi:hypothetical protein
MRVERLVAGGPEEAAEALGIRGRGALNLSLFAQVESGLRLVLAL